VGAVSSIASNAFAGGVAAQDDRPLIEGPISAGGHFSVSLLLSAVPSLPSTAAVVPTESSGQFNASKVTLQVRFRRPFGKNYRLRKQSLTERLRQIVWPSK
jgi:hypothetical protein